MKRKLFPPPRLARPGPDSLPRPTLLKGPSPPGGHGPSSPQYPHYGAFGGYKPYGFPTFASQGSGPGGPGVPQVKRQKHLGLVKNSQVKYMNRFGSNRSYTMMIFGDVIVSAFVSFCKHMTWLGLVATIPIQNHLQWNCYCRLALGGFGMSHEENNPIRTQALNLR